MPHWPKAAPWIAQAKNLYLLTTYEQRIRRSVEKNMKRSSKPFEPSAKPPSPKPKKNPGYSSNSLAVESGNYNPANEIERSHRLDRALGLEKSILAPPKPSAQSTPASHLQPAPSAPLG